jgi:hypothetical protein
MSVRGRATRAKIARPAEQRTLVAFVRATPNAIVLAKRQTTAPSHISVRYYLWSAEGSLRITQRLHRNLFDRAATLPQYAGTKQKIVEVLIWRLTGRDYIISARGEGFLDVRALALEGSLELSRFRSTETNILDFRPSIKRRCFQEQYTWKPSKTMLDDVWSDIDPGGGKKHPRLPLLWPLRLSGIGR